MDTLNRVEAEEARRQKGEIRRVGARTRSTRFHCRRDEVQQQG